MEENVEKNIIEKEKMKRLIIIIVIECIIIALLLFLFGWLNANKEEHDCPLPDDEPQNVYSYFGGYNNE